MEVNYNLGQLKTLIKMKLLLKLKKDDLKIPLLPFKIFNETLHPLGSWIGVYFTEKFKGIIKYGYTVDLIKVYNFSKSNIFNDSITLNISTISKEYQKELKD